MPRLTLPRLTLPGLLALALLAIPPAALAAEETPPSPPPGAGGGSAAPQPVGGQRDAHGCLGPAGYLWCAAQAACVRPWELAASKGMPHGEETFKALCDTPPAGR